MILNQYARSTRQVIRVINLFIQVFLMIQVVGIATLVSSIQEFSSTIAIHELIIGSYQYSISSCLMLRKKSRTWLIKLHWISSTIYLIILVVLWWSLGHLISGRTSELLLFVVPWIFALLFLYISGLWLRNR